MIDLRKLLSFADEAVSLGFLDRAINEYTDLIDANLGEIEPLMRRAILLRGVGREIEARIDLERIAEEEPTLGWPLLRLSEWASQRAEPWAAAAYVQGALAREPRSIETRVVATMIFHSLEWHDLAAATARQLPSDLEGWWGDVRRQSQIAHIAQRAAARARMQLERDELKRTFASSDLCLDLFKLGRLYLARRLCERKMQKNPRSFAAFGICTKIIAREQDPSQAVYFLQAIKFLHEDNSEYHLLVNYMKAQSQAWSATRVSATQRSSPS